MLGVALVEGRIHVYSNAVSNYCSWEILYFCFMKYLLDSATGTINPLTPNDL
jgi:hypothetical protein